MWNRKNTKEITEIKKFRIRIFSESLFSHALPIIFKKFYTDADFSDLRGAVISAKKELSSFFTGICDRMKKGTLFLFNP